MNENTRIKEGYVFFQPKISLAKININYNELLLKNKKEAVNSLDTILRDLYGKTGKKWKREDVKYRSSQKYIEGINYTKLIVDKIYIFFSWNINVDYGVVVFKKEKEINIRTREYQNIKITEDNEKKLKDVLDKINEAILAI
jgi:CRISPR/Cas system-associated exonuclease Cas4 (RecB family)